MTKRFGTLLEMLSHGVGDSIPAACQDWVKTKAAYRFLSNLRVSDQPFTLGGSARCILRLDTFSDLAGPEHGAHA